MTAISQYLKSAFPQHLWLDFSQADIERAESITQGFSNDTACRNAYLNCLCLNAFSNWVRENLDLEDASLGLPSEADLASIWEVVNGTPLFLGKTRLVLIPSDALDTEEFCIPQEWVDIPNWVANYYLAVQVDLKQNWMRIWGYTNHRTLKEKGEYDPIYRNYSLERDHAIADLDVMWIAREICTDEKAAISQLPVLSESTAKSLIAQLSQPSPYSPRLDVEFEQWGALLVNDDWRKQLYMRRQEQRVTTTAPTKMSINLNQWLKNNFTESMKIGWQTVTEFLAPERHLAIVRSTALSHSIQQAKLLNLQMQFNEQAVILLVALTPEADGRVGVLVQVHPYGREQQLPADLTLALLSESSQQLQSVMSRKWDSYIQLPYFRCHKGAYFRIQISIADVCVMEEFVIRHDNETD
jgi:Protein of unknown function (DUF1822)